MIEANVLQIIDEFTVVIDRGQMHNVEIGMEFTLYKIIQPNQTVIEMIVPDEHGIEQPVGTGEIIHVQKNISILTSTEKEEPRTEITESTRDTIGGILSPKKKTIKYENEQKPFKINKSSVVIEQLIARQI